MLNIENTPDSAPSSPIIFEADTANFEEAVVKTSMTTPVLVQFTAQWCGPCKQLSPVLEKVVTAAGGKIKLARVDLDKNQQLAAALRVQSVPAVFAFFQGQPVDAFMGVQPESQIQVLIDKLIEIARQAQPEALDIPEALQTAAEFAAANDYGQAVALYGRILQEDPKNADAYCGVVRTYIAAGDIEQAQAIYDAAPPEVAENSAFKAVQSALDLAANALNPDELAGLKAAIESNPKDHESRLKYAEALFAGGQTETAIDEALESMKIDPKWNDGLARMTVLTFFDALGNADPVTVEGRKKFSTLLFS
jgi:putative thioredoxin